ncbi:MAG TPA: hypothetical protein VKY57_01225 [Chitinispirillaceae bacterium]|nr:hypothetical protein [Chitinispirillaceae bacterium]
MKKIIIILLFALAINADNPDISLGINFMLGARYDNLRMCVASPAGAKGGPVADIMFNTRIRLDEKNSVGFKLPVMRPILFAVAFKMVQFEPEFIYEHKFTLKDDLNFVLGPGLGISLHYGPDYKTERNSENPAKFFAAGPFISNLFAVNYRNNSKDRLLGLRTFYAPLFSENKTGTVLGAALEWHIDMYDKLSKKEPD